MPEPGAGGGYAGRNFDNPTTGDGYFDGGTGMYDRTFGRAGRYFDSLGGQPAPPPNTRDGAGGFLGGSGGFFRQRDPLAGWQFPMMQNSMMGGQGGQMMGGQMPQIAPPFGGAPPMNLEALYEMYNAPPNGIMPPQSPAPPPPATAGAPAPFALPGPSGAGASQIKNLLMSLYGNQR